MVIGRMGGEVNASRTTRVVDPVGVANGFETRSERLMAASPEAEPNECTRGKLVTLVDVDTDVDGP